MPSELRMIRPDPLRARRPRRRGLDNGLSWADWRKNALCRTGSLCGPRLARPGKNALPLGTWGTPARSIELRLRLSTPHRVILTPAGQRLVKFLLGEEGTGRL